MSQAANKVQQFPEPVKEKLLKLRYSTQRQVKRVRVRNLKRNQSQERRNHQSQVHQQVTLTEELKANIRVQQTKKAR